MNEERKGTFLNLTLKLSRLEHLWMSKGKLLHNFGIWPKKDWLLYSVGF